MAFRFPKMCLAQVKLNRFLGIIPMMQMGVPEYVMLSVIQTYSAWSTTRD
jgi:hypothetical protein